MKSRYPTGAKRNRRAGAQQRQRRARRREGNRGRSPVDSEHDLVLVHIAFADSMLAAVIQDLPTVQQREVLGGVVDLDVEVLLDACTGPGWRTCLADARRRAVLIGCRD